MERSQIRPVGLSAHTGTVVAALQALARETVALIVFGLRPSRGVSR